GDDGNESCERPDGGLDRRQRSGDGGKSFEFRRQIHFGERRQETKRRLQRRVKSVSAWLTRELRPFGRGEPGVLRLTQPFAGIAVIAEEAGAGAVEGGIGRRDEVDRVSRLVGGTNLLGYSGSPMRLHAVRGTGHALTAR